MTERFMEKHGTVAKWMVFIIIFFVLLNVGFFFGFYRYSKNILDIPNAYRIAIDMKWGDDPSFSHRAFCITVQAVTFFLLVLVLVTNRARRIALGYFGIFLTIPSFALSLLMLGYIVREYTENAAKSSSYCYQFRSTIETDPDKYAVCSVYVNSVLLWLTFSAICSFVVLLMLPISIWSVKRLRHELEITKEKKGLGF